MAVVNILRRRKGLMFGYKLVKESEQPREVIRMFAEELENHLDQFAGHYYAERAIPGLDTLARESAGGVKQLLNIASDHLIAKDVVDSDEVRWRAMHVAMYMLFIADFYGDLAPIHTERLK